MATVAYPVPRLSAPCLLAALLLLAGTVAGPGLAEDQQPRIRLVAQPGDDADGLAAGETLDPDPQRDRMAIDRDGYVTFTGVADPPRGTTFVQGIFVADQDGLRALAVPGDAAPAAGGIGVTGYTVFEILDARRAPGGDTLVHARLQNAPFIDPAYLTEISGTVRTSAIERLPIPGLCAFRKLGHDFVGKSYSLNGGGLVFQGRYDDAVCPTDDHAVVMRFPDMDAFELLVDNNTIPGPPDYECWGFLGPRVGENGAIQLFATCAIGMDVFDALLLFEPTASPVIVARTGGAVPGTADTVIDLTRWLLAPPAQVGGGTRFGYVSTSSPTGDPNDVDKINVFDSASGTDPILRTGDTLDQYTFTAQPFTTYSMQPADHGQVIVVGSTTGPDVLGGEADGVWRFDPRVPPHLELVLYEGGPVPGPGGAGLTIGQIYTVNVNRRGQIAAEITLSGTGDAILIEERHPTESGRFQVAVKKGDDVPTRTGTTEVIGINRTLPSFVTVTGPGFGGLQSRFNEQNEFVFHARADYGGTIGRAVYVVSIEEPPEDCVLQAKVKGGNLHIVGGKCSCRVTVESDGNGHFRVIPGEDTLVNEEFKTWEGDADGSVFISMGGGDDHVIVRSTVPAATMPRVTDVFRNVTFDGGQGIDLLDMAEFQVGGSLTIRTGDGETDQARIANTEVQKHFKLHGGDGRADLDVASLEVHGKTSIRNGNDTQSSLDLVSCTLWKTKILGGRGQDLIHLDRCDVSHTLKINTGKIGTDVRLDQGTYARKVTIKTGGSHLVVSNVVEAFLGDFERSLVVRGKGSHEILVDDCVVKEGVAINLKKGAKDTVEVRDTEIGKGLLQVRSRATVFEGMFARNTVADGALYVRSSKGSDKVTIEDCSATVAVQVILSWGDDELSVNGTTVDGKMRLGGGGGTDTLNYGNVRPNTVGGKTTMNSFP